MKDLIKVQQKLIPDLIDKMYRRFYILSTIAQNQPVGRRSLSEHMDMTERVLRSETDMLKKQELIRVKPTGMEITNEGTEVLAQLGEYFNVYSDDHKLARAIKDSRYIYYLLTYFLFQLEVDLEKMSFIKRILSLRVWPNKLAVIIPHSMSQTT